MSLPTIVFVAPAAVCALSWLGIGAALPERWVPAGRLAEALARTAFGVIVVGLALLAAGSLDLLARWWIVVATVALAAVGARCAWRLAGPRPLIPEGRTARILLALVGLALVVDLVAASGPPTSPDALKYHAALPDRWLLTGHIAAPFFLWEGFNPSTIEMLYLQGLAFASGGEAASAVGALLCVLAAAAIYGLGRELAGATAGAAAAALFLLQGVVTWEATSMFVELGVTFFAVLAVWLAVRAARLGSPVDAVWAGLACGGGAACKYLGLLAAAPVLTGLSWTFRRRWTTVAAATAAFSAVAGAWYLRNLAVTGNPVYPLFFGGAEWGSDDQRELDLVAERYGVGGSPLRLVVLPFDLLAHGDSFDRGRYVGVGIFLLAAIALVVVRTRVTVALALGSAAYLLVWWAGSSQARFLLPVIAVLAALAGAALLRLLDSGGLVAAGAWVAVALTVAGWAAPSYALTRQLVPAAVGAESAAEASQRLTGTSDALHDASRIVGAGALGVVEYQFTFHYPGDVIPLGSARFGPGTSRADAVRFLKGYGVTHVLAPSRATSPLVPILRPCLARVQAFDAKLVLSRSRAESVPYPLTLYALRYRSPGCGA